MRRNVTIDEVRICPGAFLCLGSGLGCFRRDPCTWMAVSNITPWVILGTEVTAFRSNSAFKTHESQAIKKKNASLRFFLCVSPVWLINNGSISACSFQTILGSAPKSCPGRPALR